jgi:hypothetical protein
MAVILEAFPVQILGSLIVLDQQINISHHEMEMFQMHLRKLLLLHLFPIFQSFVYICICIQNQQILLGLKSMQWIL